LNLTDFKEITWHEALIGVHINNNKRNPNTIFITPSINGWVLLIGFYFTSSNNRDAICIELSKQFGLAGGFEYDAWSGLDRWVLAYKGKIFGQYDQYDASSWDFLRGEFDIQGFGDGLETLTIFKKLAFDLAILDTPQYKDQNVTSCSINFQK
jgi:hypothetical protein